MGLVAVFSSYPYFATIWNYWIPSLCPARKLGLMGKWMHPTEKDHEWISLTRGTYKVHEASPRIPKSTFFSLYHYKSCHAFLFYGESFILFSFLAFVTRTVTGPRPIRSDQPRPNSHQTFFSERSLICRKTNPNEIRKRKLKKKGIEESFKNNRTKINLSKIVLTLVRPM